MMDVIDFEVLARSCAPHVHVQTMAAIVRTESGYNPFAIGVVDGALVRQPRTRDEAVATAKALLAGGWNFSLGLSQVNLHQLPRYGLSLVTAFEPCRNLRAGSAILAECFDRARATPHGRDEQSAVRDSLSCYYSGNFLTGYHAGYVNRVEVNAAMPIGVVRLTPLLR